MHFFIKDEMGVRPVEKLSAGMTRQAVAIADCDGRMIPQEGIDYVVDIKFTGDSPASASVDITPLTDKGELWKAYVMKCIHDDPSIVEAPEVSLSDTKEHVAALIHTAFTSGVCGLIPKPEKDYHLEITFNGEYSSNVSMNVAAITDRGMFWRDYVIKMMRKYPPTLNNPAMAIEETNQENIDETVMP